MSEDGSATVELALLLPLILLVLVTVTEVATVGRVQLALTAAARHGARVAATHPDPAEAVAAVQREFGAELADRLIVSVDRPSIVGREAVVALSFEHRLFSALFPGPVVELQSRAVMRVER